MAKGQISIDAQNIMPVIKRWLYSDKDIFIREMVSNGCDAITKRKMLAIGEDIPYRVTVTVDKDNGIISFTDNGIGMTSEEVEKYINQVAFSGAQDFLKNYAPDKKDDGGIIGHFGLGFYSAFMVAKKVTIDTLSCKDGAEAVKWISEDGMEFDMSLSERKDVGTTMTLELMDDEKEFLDGWKVREILEKYCGFMAVPIYLNVIKTKDEIEADKKRKEDAKKRKAEEKEKKQKEREEKLAKGESVPDEDAEEEDTEAEEKPEEEKSVNNPQPLWMKAPKDCTDEEYKEFYHSVFHDYTDPLFWIHLNVDYPFNLKGILYFPKLKNDFGTVEGQIKLFSGQVFVADNIKEVIPEFLMLLKGVIDCPDLPLNVSRSFLQNDGYVKKISAHITKKVADKLNSLFETDREAYQKYWDDINPFVKYGCMRDSKFFESVSEHLLFKTTEGEYLTLAEYGSRNEGKVQKRVFYTNDHMRQAGAISMYRQQGIDVLLLEHPIDVNFLSFMEYSVKEEDKRSFCRVDADVSGLTEESTDGADIDLSLMEGLFRKALDKKELKCQLQALKNRDLPAMLLEEEQGRRFKEMSKMYGESFKMPDQFTLVLNRLNPTVRALAASDENDETTQLLVKQVYDLARIQSQQLEPDELTEFLSRSNKIVELLAEKK